jgi:hypothetical protein
MIVEPADPMFTVEPPEGAALAVAVLRPATDDSTTLILDPADAVAEDAEAAGPAPFLTQLSVRAICAPGFCLLTQLLFSI